MPLFGVRPIRPPLSAFVWPEDQLSLYGPHPKTVLQPTPSITPPAGYAYPQAETYHLNSRPDPRYATQYFYVAPYDTAFRSILFDRMVRTILPPVTPTFNGERMIWNDIPGGVELPEGYPVAQVVNGDPDNIQTKACFHSLRSLKRFPVAANAETFLTELASLMWGKPAEDGNPEISPVYKLPGLIRNDRSAPDLPKDSPCGSFNLAATLGKGEGRGRLIPGAQVATPEALSQIKRILTLVYELRQIVLQCSLNNFEWSMLKFHATDNNVFGFGGLGPNGTGCQLNVSSGGRDLKELFGIVQGSLHADESDDPCDWTVMFLFLRLPPGETINDSGSRWFTDECSRE